jgi:tetratricopeptide (TPR) repeat protein
MPRVALGSWRLPTGWLTASILGGALLGGFWFWWRGGARVNPLQRGTTAYDSHDWQAAEQVARQRLKEHPDDAEALRLLARSWFRQSRDQPALAIHGRLADELMAAEDYFLRGQALARMGQKELAILLWRQALGRDVNHIDTLVALEQLLFQLDLLNEAARAAERLSAQPGWEARAALMLGAIRAEQADPAGAAAALERALARADQWHGADRPDRVRKLLARFLLQTGRPAQARAALLPFAGTAEDPEAGWLLSRCDLQQGVTTDPAVSAVARSYRQARPMEPEPAPFVGETRCLECHKALFQAQHQSRHARTFFRKEQFPSLPLPERSVAEPANPKVTHSFGRSADGIEVRTQAGDRLYQTIVDYAFGSGDRGLTLVGHDPEGRYFEYRLSHYSDPVGWDVTSGQPPRPDYLFLYQGMRITLDAVRRCLVCHTTHPQAILNESGPESSDSAIGCERCHGPGSHHLKAVAARMSDLAIARPLLATGPDIVGLCSQCHSPRDKNFNPSPGSLESVRFQGMTLTWSRCYSEGRNLLDCVTCHDPHRNAETAPAWYESRCLECHATRQSVTSRFASSATGPVRSEQVLGASCPIQPDRDCLGCHMPKVQIPSAHAVFTDHFIRVHRDSGHNAAPPLRPAR